jgi:hypothetical protein
MNKQQFDKLRQQAIEIVTRAIQDIYVDDDILSDVENGLFKNVLRLPKHPEVIRTFNGIVGFNEYLKEKPNQQSMCTNGLHDLSECCRNYHQSWFSPRLGRYGIKPELTINQY